MDAMRLVRVLAVGLPLAATPLAAQTQAGAVDQTLDTVQVFGGTKVLERVDDPLDRPLRYVDTGLAGASALRACQLTPTAGLFCLDGDTVVQWTDTEDPSSRTPLFSCGSVPGLVGCTGLTAESTGAAIWVAGTNRGRTHNLVKVARSTSGAFCPTSWQAIGSTGYSACTWVTGRPLLVDITSVDGSAATALNPSCTSALCAKGPGILGLEERRRVVFYPTGADSTVPRGSLVEIASGKTGWGLSGNEQLLGATLYQAGGTSYVIASTSAHKLLRSTTDGTSVVLPLLWSWPAGTVGRSPDSLADSACTSRSPQYGLRGSAKSSRLYVTDRDCKRTLAFTLSSSTTLDVVEELSTGTVAPEGPTIAAGRAYSLTDYSGETGKPLLAGSGTLAAAELSKVTLVDQTKSGLVLFQVQNIPDCRWTSPRPAVCGNTHVYQKVAYGAIDGSSGKPLEQRLNATALLPKEVTDVFAAKGGLPPLYIQPDYRGQRQNSFLFEALFAVTEDGVYFTDNYEMLLRVNLLTSNKRQLGCTPLQTGSLPAGTPLATLLGWDVATKVSENYIGIGGTWVDTLVNIGCGSTRIAGSRTSLISYNLEVAPNRKIVTSNSEVTYGYSDTVYLELLSGLYDELNQATVELACEREDGSVGTPLSSADCATLQSIWANGKDKLEKCFQATTQPKSSAGDQNCQSFVSQLSNFRSRLASAPACGADLAACDPANRRGELAARLRTIEHVYYDRFAPSIPPAGFGDKVTVCDQADRSQACPAPPAP